MSEDNNTGVPLALHITTTVIVLIVFFISLQQSFSISVGHRLFKIRLGVLLSNAILCALSIVLNVELMDVVDDDFVLIVRTLQILWLFVAFFIGYFFVTNSIKSAYSSTMHNDYIKNIKTNTPQWIAKLWFVCTILMEITLFICYIIAFTTVDILYFHILWTITFSMAVIGAILVLSALIDIRIKSQKIAKIQNKKLNKMNRLITTMIILCLIVIIACTINITILINHLSKAKKRPGSLYSTVIDNTLDYVTYMICLLFIEMLLVFWTYKSSSINYCLYPIYGYKKNKILYNDNFILDKNTLCYVFCKHIIDKADKKRLLLRKEMKELNKINIPNNIQTRPMKSSVMSSGKYHSNIASNEMIDFKNENDEIFSEQRKIEILLYDFDGVLTTECKYRYFEHWSDNDISSLTRKHMNTIFGDDNRVNIIKNNFIKWKSNGKQLKIISYETTNKINQILNKIGLDKYFDEENDIIGCDNKIFNNESKVSIKYFILKLISMQQIEYDEILYISADEENVTHFKNINLCQCYHVKLNGGINENDIKLIDKLYC